MAARKKPIDRGAGGRQTPWVADELTRKRVMLMSGAGFSVADIALAIGASAKSLQRHCLTELRSGKARMNEIAVSAFVRGPLSKGDVAAFKWWSQARMNWHEPIKQLALEGKDGAPLIAPTLIVRFVDPPPNHGSPDAYRQPLPAPAEPEDPA